MPELPEVETVARGLQKSVAGRRIVSVRLGKTDFIDDPAALERQLPGLWIEKVERYGKFMLLRLSARGFWEWRCGGGVAAGASGNDWATCAVWRCRALREAYTRMV